VRGQRGQQNIQEPVTVSSQRLGPRSNSAPMMIDHFKVMRLLGQGGMGEVYLARDTKLGRKVALKVVRSESLAPRTHQRFLHEARMTARFNHPHIVTIHAVGEFDGRPYVALEYLEGQTLRDRMVERRLSLQEAMRIGVAVAEALVEAHRNSVLHRDLKPANVIIAQDGGVRVLDFGLARMVTPDPGGDVEAPPSVTAAPSFTAEEGGGTPYYMAPEQWRCETSSAATDVWALGVILFELCALRHPFVRRSGDALGSTLRDSEAAPSTMSDSDPATQLQSVAAPTDPADEGWNEVKRCWLNTCAPEPAPLLDSLVQAPPQLSELVARCLEKEPALRPQAAEVVSVLSELVHGERPSDTEADSPFRGLLPFTERHASQFFGRQREVSAFLERVRLQPILPVVGPAGSGKTSFVCAGVIPRLREQQRWTVLELRPSNRPFRALATSLLRLTGYAASSFGSSTSPATEIGESAGGRMSLPDTAQLEELEQRLRQPGQIAAELRSLAEHRQSQVLVFVDQLEELFTLVAEPEVRRCFLEEICSAADDPLDPVRVLLAVRGELLGRLATGALVREALARVCVLQQLDDRALSDTLVKPIEALSYRFDEPTLVAEMVAAVQQEQAGLALLQFAAQMLWERRDATRKLLLRAAYDEMGGVEGAVAKHADGVLDGFSAAELEAAREMLLRLVSPERTRRVVARALVIEGLGETGERVLGRLLAARLLGQTKSREDAERQAFVELAHESLIGRWSTLSRWVDESREDLAFITEVQQAAELWRKHGRRPGELWAGGALRDALRNWQRCATPLPELAAKFLQTAKDRAQARVRKRRWLLVGAFATLALVAVVLAVQKREADYQKAQAQQQREVARGQRADALREGARAALEQGNILEAAAKLRMALSERDSAAGRALWWQLDADPRIWHKELGALVYSVSFSPDGKLIAAASQDTIVYLFDTATRTMRMLRGHSDQVFSVAFSADGRRLATGAWSGEIGLWDVETLRKTKVLRGHQGRVWSLSFDPKGRWLASASGDKTIRLWDLASGKARKVLNGHTGPVYSVVHSPDGKRLATSSEDTTVRLWSPTTGRLERLLSGHRNGIEGLSFSPDGRTLASSSLDHTVRLWAPDSGALIRELKGHTGGVRSVSFGTAGRQLASGSYDRSIRIWDVATGKQQAKLSGHRAAVRSVSFSPTGRQLVSGGYDRAVRLWNIAARPRMKTQEGHTGGVLSVAFSPDGRQLASASYDTTVRMWDVASGAEQRVLRGHSGGVFDVAYDPAGRTIISASLDKSVRLWDVASGAQRRVLSGHTGSVYAAAYSPDGTRIATASRDHNLHLYDASTGALLRVLSGHSKTIHDLVFSPDGSKIASAGSDMARVWDAATGEQLFQVAESKAPVRSVAFNPDGRHFATASLSGEINQWPAEGGESKLLGRHDGRVYRLHFHHEGQLLGAPTSDGTTRIWNVADGSFRVLRGHRNEANCARFSADGELLATASDDATIRLWHVASGRPYWRAPLLLRPRSVGAPALLLSHLGWRSLSTAAPVVPAANAAPPSARWRKAVEGRARWAAQGPDGLLCLHGHNDALELWDLRADRQLAARAVDGAVEQVLAVEGGCIARAGPAVWRIGVGGGSKLPVEGEASAIGHAAGELLVAAGSEVLAFDRAGAVSARYRAGAGVAALTRLGQWIAVGYGDGNLELVATDPKQKSPAYSFDHVPASRPLRMMAGPMDTLIVGYANGLLGLWNVRDGTRLAQARLHGPIAHMLLEGEQLYVASEFGRSLVWDLSPFYADYCALVRALWARIPVVWEAGNPMRKRSHPGHRCFVGNATGRVP